MRRELTIQEALTELAAAKIEIESMQQQLVSFPCKALHFTKFIFQLSNKTD